ncbi:MFS transporter [Thalassospiraceae bacterium LMO-SO8]|nr:MFS transporter [Alphaproteobacteria bacterium LMO-S08]WND74354.1 MFS transporter [Thalassospiraceae bacterium LMO-SO8]
MFRTPGPVLITVLMCLAQVATLVDVFVFATLIRTFETEWLLTKVEQGWVLGIYHAGYVLAVPVIMALTDRVDARRLYMAGCLFIALAAAGFAFLAEGFWSALLLRALSGFGFAATYMPGLRVLVDRYPGGNEGRAIAFYTSSWSLGTAVSYLLAGVLGEALGWQAAFLAGGAGALAAFVLVLVCLTPLAPTQAPEPTRLLDFRPVLRNRPAMGYVLGYAAHTYELLAFRAWLVAFLAFSLTRQAEPMVGWLAEPSRIAMFTALAAMISSIAGNELAQRLDRPRFIAAVQCLTASLACVIGFLGALPYEAVVVLVILYALLVQADSASLTAGVVGAAEDGRRGATLAVYNLVGWTCGFAGPVLVGAVLGAAGTESTTGWGMAFMVMGGVTFLGAAAVRILAGTPRAA